MVQREWGRFERDNVERYTWEKVAEDFENHLLKLWRGTSSVINYALMKELKKPTVVIIKSSPWKSAHVIRNHPEYSAISNLIQRYGTNIRLVLVGTSSTPTSKIVLQGDVTAWDIQTGKVGLLTFYMELMKLLFKYRPRLVIVLGGLNMLPVPIYCLLSRKARYVSVFAGSFGYYARKEIARFLSYLTFRVLGILFVLSQGKILGMYALSRYVREGVKKMAPALKVDIKLISYPISPTFDFSVNYSSTDTFKEPVVLTVAAIQPVKGLDILIKAVSFVKKKLKVLIIGGVRDLGYAHELTQLVKELGLEEKIKFTGRIEYDSLPSYYKSATLFVFPSRQEGLGVVLLEALHCNLPVIATSVGGIPDMIENGMNGLLVKPDDPYELANAISLLLDDNAKREEFAKNARRILLNKYYKGRITLEEALDKSVTHLLVMS